MLMTVALQLARVNISMLVTYVKPATIATIVWMLILAKAVNLDISGSQGLVTPFALQPHRFMIWLIRAALYVTLYAKVAKGLQRIVQNAIKGNISLILAVFSSAPVDMLRIYIQELVNKRK